jgi:uncharacterized membrane protein
MRTQTVLNFLQNYWDKIILILLVILYIAVLGGLSILRHNAFASGYDLSNMDQTLWYTLHGHFFSLRDPEEIVSRFSIHADLILILLSPLYFIKDDIRMLLASQSIILALGAIPVYFLSLRLLKSKLISLVITIAYLLNPGMEWTNIYGFHGVSLSITFMLSAFYFAYVKKWKWYGLFILLALLTKEQISLNVAMLGLAIFFVFKERRVGFVTFVVGVLWFFAMIYIVTPYFTPKGAHWALVAYGETNFFKIITRFMNPSVFIQTFLLDKVTINYYMLLLKPFAFMPILGLPWLFLSAPALAINIIRDTRTITFHYDASVTPALAIATAFGFYYLQRILNYLKFTKRYARKILYVIAGIFLIVALRVNYHYSPLPTTPSCWCYIYNVTKEDKDFEKVLQSLPKDAFITTSLEIRPHVNHRELVFSVPSATESAQYIALITQNRLIGNYEPKDYENKLIPLLLADKNHQVVFKSEHFYLFKKIDFK